MIEATGKLAIQGGPKAKPTQFSTSNRYGEEELAQLKAVIESGKLMGPDGKVREFEEAVAKAFGVKHVIMVTSGTAALHTALAALGVSEGDEVITTPMTDIGTVSAILALHAVPVFADIDLATRLISPESARQRLTKRTKVVITVHMAGLPCDLDAFMKLGAETGVRILEDCAQAHGGTHKGRFLGAIGHAAGFSMNESKQMTTGDGGFVATNDDATARIANLFRDKTYIRDGSVGRGGQPIPFFGLNYRPTCLQAAVGIAQLQKLNRVVSRRDEIVQRYYRELTGLRHLELPRIVDGGRPSWWPLPARYIGTAPTRDEIVSALTAEGIPISTGMSPANNILRTELFARKKYYPLSDK
ncbi:MAG: DegT/DnrJ/EryC1/StrS family aminotransferase, partial [Planctomycetes bacterium]|nr:DegT/DnrJ/EryC1/StrS family aminotransferase [Planctomycetota bacterium]